MYLVPVLAWPFTILDAVLTIGAKTQEYVNTSTHVVVFDINIGSIFMIVLFPCTCTVEETSNTAVGSTTGAISATTVPPMDSGAQHITPLPSTYQAPQLQQPEIATPSQLQPPGMNILYHCKSVQAVLEVLLKYMTPSDWFVGDHAPREEVHIPMETLSEVDGGTYACAQLFTFV